MTVKVSDEEFLKAWSDSGGSPIEVSRILDLSIRNVYSRRNNLEAKLGTLLPTETPKAIRNDPSHAKMILSSRRDVHRLEIENGVIIVGSDAHYSPGHTPVAHKALCNVVADLKKDVAAIILNGDILDGGGISRHPRIRWQKRHSVKDELEVVKERLGEIEKIRPAGAHLVRTYGNHCARFETRLANQVPEYEGIGGFLLRDHLPLWHDADRVDINDDTVVLHDWHSGVHSGWNDTLKGGCNVITGHTHELGCKAHRGFKDTHYGIKTGMLADEFQDEFEYRLGKPGLNWQSGFAVLTWVDGMMLFPEFAAVRDDGKCYFRGTRYA